MNTARVNNQDKNEVLESVRNNRLTVSSGAEKLGVSRQTLYSWLAQPSAFATTEERSERFDLRLDPQIEKNILASIKVSPQKGLRAQYETVSAYLKNSSPSFHGFYNVLKRNNLLSGEAREKFSASSDTLTPDFRKQLLTRVNQGENISDLSKAYGMSRQSIYNWKEKFSRLGEGGLIRKSSYAKKQSKLTTDDINKVLGVIAAYPNLSVSGIYEKIKAAYPQVSFGRHAIYNLMCRYNLKTQTDRTIFAGKQQHVTPEFSSSQTETVNAPISAKLSPDKLPAPPPDTIQYPAAPLAPQVPFAPQVLPELPNIKTSRNNIIFVSTLTAFFIGLYAFLSVQFIATITVARSLGELVGFGFAFMALSCGMFFFIYSIKYYLISLAVMIFTRNSLSKKDTSTLWNGRMGLKPQLDQVSLTRKPFVSIHVPLYNEKRVVNRLLDAVTKIDYENYEVIVCDDSTDETKDLVLDWAKHPRIKISHRDTRAGFKGAALKQALRIMDPRTEFVLVFDADFLPFPDIVENFFKYFQSAVGSLDPATYSKSTLAAIQGYQWHVLNKSENWVTRGVRSEYAGSYVLERTAAELYGGLKQIAGSVFMIRADVLKSFDWGTSITEDFQLTLRLYAAGYRVMYSPYIQAPSECVSTIKRLIRQRMRWAEGHSFNTRRLFLPIMTSKKNTLVEKAEFAYLTPYYLQSFLFIVGTLAWFISETIFKVRLPLWTAIWGWSLVLVNIFSLPLMNIIGLLFEEAEERDYFGIFSFVLLSYIVAPFQAYAAVKGFMESEEGPWNRTPKTGRITDSFTRGRISRWLFGIFTRPQKELSLQLPTPKAAPVFARRNTRRIGNLALSFLLIVSVVLSTLSPKLGNMPTVNASEPALGRVGETQDGKMGRPEDGKMGERKDSKERNPTNKAEILENISRKEISGKRIISRTSKGGKNVDYIFGSEPDITIKLDGYEVQFVTKLLAGKVVRPQKATMLHDKEVLYSEIIKDVDLRYRLTNDLLVEEFIVKTPEAAKLLGASIEQEVRGVGIQFVSPTPETFGIYSKDGKEIFTLSQPFAVDAKGVKNNDFKFELNNGFAGYTLTKKFGASVENWFKDPSREYPIIIDPSVVVTGGIAEGDTQFGGLQRKVVFVNSNWYAFYNDAGVVSYQKSADGVSWGGAVTVSDGDADNYNPSVAVSGNVIIAGWVDTSTSYDMRSIETDNSDGLGANCNLGGATMTTSQMLSIAATSTTSVLIASSDTAGDTDVGVVEFTSIDLASTATTCAFADRTTGTITFGAGLTAGDRPVMVSIGSNRHAMIFQDGDLSYSIYDDTLDEWVLNNLTIASVTDNVYSVVSDGAGKVWILSVSGTTATNFYSCCTDDWAETSIDADAGANNQDGTSDIDMFCPSEDNCKIVYTDDIDTTAPILKFVDCNDATCSSPTITSLDTDIGASGDQAGASIYCVSDGDGVVSDNCKIAYGDAMDTTLPLLNFIDCTNDEDCSTNTNTGSVDADLGGATSILHTAIHCPADDDCKILYNDSALSDLFFVDCPDATCTATGRTITTLDATSGTAPELDMDCSPGATDCKVVYHDTSATGGCADAAALCMMDCGNATCTVAGGTFTAVDGDIGATTDQPVVAIDCSAGSTDCKIVYGDVTAGDAFFVDCPDSACTATGRTITTLDTAGGAAAQVFSKIDIDCVSATDCKLSYVGNTTTGSEEGYFIDCDGAACATGSVVEMKGPRFGGAVVCLTSTNCKFAYYDGTSAANPAVVFADCDVTNCFPSASSLTAPWTSETNVTSVSLTYDSSNSDLYAHIIKDASEQAYWNSSDATTISWNGSTSYGFTAGDLGHISAPITAAGTTQVGVVVRQGTNFEFSVVPENVWLLAIAAPVYYFWRRRKSKLGYNRLLRSKN